MKSRVISFFLVLFLVISFFPTITSNNVSATASNDYTQWRQSDPQWNYSEAWPASQYPAATAHYMSQAGCLVVSVAMLLRQYEVVTETDVNKFNPWICNEALKAAGAFNSAADMYWAGPEKAYPGFKYVGSASYSESKLISLFSQGYACIVKVNGSGGYEHFVAVRSATSAGITIMDPGWGYTSLNSFSTKYEIRYWKPTPSSPPSYYLDVNGWLDGTEQGSLLQYGTFDVYINGNAVEYRVNDYYTQWRKDSTYKIVNIRPAEGYSYDGIYSGNREGAVSSDPTRVLLAFSINDFSKITETPTKDTYNGHTYLYYSTPVTWYFAKEFCENQGGHLVYVTTAAEDEFVKSMISGNQTWIGATDDADEKIWRWLDGTDVQYAPWNAGEPNNSSTNDSECENYSHYTVDGYWNDTNGCQKMGFICEIDQLDHEHILQHVPAVTPTCTEAGNTEYWYCSGCQKYYSDASGNNRITQEATVVGALGHNFSSEVIPATCTQYAGIKYTCTRTGCGYTYTEYSDAEYSDWSTDYPTGVEENLIESRTEWRYSDYETTTSYNTSMTGWTQKSSEWQQSDSGTINYVTSWPSGFSTSHSLYSQYNNSPKSASETATDKTVINSTGTAGWIYYHWCRGTYSGGPINRATSPYYTSEFNSFHAFFSTTNPNTLTASSDGDGSYTYPNGSCCTDSHWYYPITVSYQNYTTYKKLFTYERWTDWSEWSTVEYTPSDTREVDTQTVYRYITTPIGEHSWNEGVITTPASCSATGLKTFTCTRCGETKTEAIAKLEHSYQEAIILPSCITQGYTSHTCTVCGDTYTDTYVDELGHDFLNHEAQKPTCTEIGWEAYDTCSRCDYSTYVEIKALGHDLIHHEAQAPTCTEIGWEAYDTCSRCDYSTYVEKSALNHDYTAVVTAPTCADKGYTTYTCTRCGDSYVADEVAALEHTPGAAVEENRLDPTCTANGGFDTVTYCSVCGAELSRVHTSIAALEHNWDDGVIDPAATCTTDGAKTYTCKRCGETKTEAIAAYGHTPGESAKENEVAVTCTTAGSYDIVIRCTTCNEILFFEHFEIDALDHNWDDGVINPAATCTTNGIKTFTCRRCGEKKTETIEASGHTPGESAKENEVAATCTTAGSYDMVIRCTTCNEILYTEHYESAALGHDWDDGEITTPATATTGGIKTFTCKRCGATKTEAIPATGEDACKHESTHPEHKDATCVEAGYDKMICDKCGAVVSEETIPALGHDLVADEAVAATCTATGLTAGEHCTRCDYKLAQETVPALGHDWGEGKVTTPATETTNGVMTFTCKRCGATKTETIPAMGGEDKPCDGGKDCPSYKFKDVNYGDWYHEAVDFAVKNGLFNGMSDTTFEPNTPMTRGMLVTVLWRYEGQPEGGANTFADVKDGEWYAKAVAWAASKGIVNGVGQGKFDPNGKITREQLAAILYRYSESKGFDTSKVGNLNTFPDAAKVSDWAKTAYSWAVGEGLIGGNVINGKTLLDPQGNATRAQVATILMRYINKIA